MKLLLLGKSGQVGEALQATLAPLGHLVAWGREEASFENPAKLSERVAAQNADVIVNAAAYTAVDKAESDATAAFLVNAEAVSALASVAARRDGWLVHYSTDYVFDGRKADAYVEDDATNPLGVYGASKLAGDEAIAASGCSHLIFRVSWVYAPGHANFPRSMLRLAQQKSSLNVVADQVGAPTSAALIATTTAEAIASVAKDREAKRLSGLYNLAASGTVDRAEMARFIVREATAFGFPPVLQPDAIKPIATSDFPTPAARPLNSRLDTTKLRRTFNACLSPWQDDMREWVKRELTGDQS